jgi:3'-5' exoribonuclease
MVDHMGKKQMVADLKEGDEVDSHFSISYRKYPRAYRDGHSFELRLQDSSGQINAVYWGGREQDQGAVQELYDSIKERDVVHVRGKVSIFRDALQIGIDPGRGHVVEKSAFSDLSCFVPTSPRDLDEMMRELDRAVEQIANADMRSLLQHFFADEGFRARFRVSPAAITHHCNRIGGLLEHTLNTHSICGFMAVRYSELDRDLLLTGALLHDIGKVREYVVTSGIDCTLEGRLVGHVVMGGQMVDEACGSIPGFPGITRLKLVHMVLSSHGKLECGSPKTPSFPEATVLAQADQMTATVEKHISLRAEACTRTQDDWTWDREYGGIFLR